MDYNIVNNFIDFYIVVYNLSALLCVCDYVSFVFHTTHFCHILFLISFSLLLKIVSPIFQSYYFCFSFLNIFYTFYYLLVLDFYLNLPFILFLCFIKLNLYCLILKLNCHPFKNMYFISLLLSLLNFFLRYFKIPTLCYFSFYLTLILIQPNILCSFCYFNTQSTQNLPYILQCIYFQLFF